MIREETSPTNNQTVLRVGIDTMTKLCPLSLKFVRRSPRNLIGKCVAASVAPSCSLTLCQTESSTELLCFTQDSEGSLQVVQTFHTNARSCNGRFYYHCYDEKLQKFGATRWQHAVFDLFLAVQAKIQHKITNGVGQKMRMASLLFAQ